MYSLGVVLWEIAYWQPLASKIQPKDAKSLESIRKLCIESADQRLDAAVGSTYAGVVRVSLQCRLPNSNLGAEFACAISTGFVLQLEHCIA